MLSVLFVQRQQKCREHGEDHKQGSGGVSQRLFGEKEQGNTYNQSGTEAHQLPFRQVEQHLGFDLRQIFGNGYIGHRCTSLMGVEYGTGKAAGFEQAEAEQHGIAHAGPDGGTNVAGYGNVLYQH